jgi:hypothetical protein
MRAVKVKAQAFIVLGAGPDRKLVDIDKLNTYDESSLIMFIGELNALSDSLGQTILALRKQASADPNDISLQQRLSNVIHKQAHAIFFLGKAKTRYGQLQGTLQKQKPKPKQKPKLTSSWQDHDEHQKSIKRFSYFTRAAFNHEIKLIIGEDEFHRLKEKARLKAIEKFTNWAKTAEVNTKILEHITLAVVSPK